MMPSDEFLRHQAQGRVRDKLVKYVESLDALVKRLETVIEDEANSPAIRAQLALTLSKVLPRRDRLREIVGDVFAYDWIVHKGVVRGMPFF